MASASSRSSIRSSASSSRRVGEDREGPPVPYREGPLQYTPPIYCKCGQKAGRWISWTSTNPGRRYYTCMRRWAGGCNFWLWHDADPSTYLKQLLIDLRDKIRDLTKENANLRGCSISEGRAELDQMYMQQLLVQERRAVAEKNVQLAALGERVKKLEKQRAVLLLAILVCACVSSVCYLGR